MSGIFEDLQKINKEIQDKVDEKDKLLALCTLYPDIQKKLGRWGKVAYYSKSANDKVNRFDIRHNCGCCSDSPLEIWPYLETEVGKIYSDPPVFQVGEKDYRGGDRPYTNWKEAFIKAKLPEAIIGAIEQHFKSCRYSRIEDALEDSEIPEPDEVY